MQYSTKVSVSGRLLPINNPEARIKALTSIPKHVSLCFSFSLAGQSLSAWFYKPAC